MARWLFASRSLLALLGGAIIMPEAAQAQCRLCPAPTTEAPSDAAGQAVSIDVQARLDFDQIVVTGGSGVGTARLLPDGTATTTGSVGVISGRAMVGSVTVRGEPGRLIRVGLPRSITLHGLTGGRINLDSLVTDLPAQPRLDSQGSLQFRFGGALHVQGDAEGNFRGDVAITVDYL